MQKLSGSWSSRFVSLMVVIVILTLSYQLRQLKRARVSLVQGLEATTRAPVLGVDLPRLAIVDRLSVPIRLADLCRPGRPMVVVFTTAGCPACALVQDDWVALPRRRTDADVVAVYTDLPPERLPGVEGIAVHALGPAESVTIRSTPSVLVTDDACATAGSASGVEAVRVLLHTASAGRI